MARNGKFLWRSAWYRLASEKKFFDIPAQTDSSRLRQTHRIDVLLFASFVAVARNGQQPSQVRS
jgi:hypothetical protein